MTPSKGPMVLKKKRKGPITLAKGTAITLALILVLWETLLLLFGPLPESWGKILAPAFLLALLAALFLLKPRRKGLLVALVLMALPLIYWFSLKPSNNRDWRKDLAVLPYATIKGDEITIHNIRNCDYRTDKDYDVHYYTKTFNLKDLCCVDMILSDWGLKKIVHTMFSFGFKKGDKIDYVCISIEVRKEKGEGYSSIRGFFRNYEIIYIVGDERDLIRLRTNFRKNPPEEVRLYRLKPQSPQVLKKVFLDFMERINRLREHPQWYNALTSNCMTSAFFLMKPDAPRAKFDWRLILNGYADRLLYEKGIIDTNLSFQELRKESLINKRAQAADNSPDFSRLIREQSPRRKK